MSSSAFRQISEEQRMEIYDRLASKWASKMEAKMAQKQLLKRHPNLIITSAKKMKQLSNTGMFIKDRGKGVTGMAI